ncbi:hypothetical protein, partial [Amycolatopsis sp.]|uniref:hypothetical protein n=1 Tax=Amycolatopsis sp. TaxID=37632 RepID=UPI002B6EB20A
MAAVTAVSLAACSSGAGPQPAPESTVAATVSPEAVPAAFDNTKGWMVEGSESTEFDYPAFAPQAGLILLLANKSDSAQVEARDAKTGATRWTGSPVPETDARLFVTNENGKEYAVVVGKTHAYVYDVASAGGSVAAQRDFASPEANDVAAQRDGRVLVDYAGGTAVLDAASGQVARYEQKVVAASANGPVVQGHGAFSVPGGWSSADAVPAGATTGDVKAIGSPDGSSLVAEWPSPAGEIWAVHDMRSGQVLASVPCRGEDSATPAVSVDGRYLIAGPVAFDLQAKKGFCFGDKGTDLTAVDPDGTVYGANDTEPGAP